MLSFLHSRVSSLLLVVSLKCEFTLSAQLSSWCVCVCVHTAAVSPNKWKGSWRTGASVRRRRGPQTRVYIRASRSGCVAHSGSSALHPPAGSKIF